MISRVYSGAVLLFAVFTTLATSLPSYQRSFVPGTYRVKSDCPNGQAEGQLTIEIFDPSELGQGPRYRLDNGTAFGFPSNDLIAGRVTGPESGGTVTVQDAERICKAMLWEAQDNSGLFVCHRGDALECTIHLKKI